MDLADIAMHLYFKNRSMVGKRKNFQTVLAEVVHYMDLRPFTIRSCLAGKDTFIMLPTGYGKSVQCICCSIKMILNSITYLTNLCEL